MSKVIIRKPKPKNPEFTKKILEFRLKHRLGVQQAAASLEVPMSSYQQWLAGALPHIDRQTLILQRIANFKP